MEPHVINKPGQPPSLYILFIADGFRNTDDDLDAFLQFCRLATESLFKVYPFSIARNSIGVWAHASMMDVQGTTNDSLSSQFDIQFNQNKGVLWTEEEQKIYNIIANLTIRVPGTDRPISARQKWLSGDTSDRIICVVNKSYASDQVYTKSKNELPPLFVPADGDLTEEQWKQIKRSCVVPYTILTLWQDLDRSTSIFGSAPNFVGLRLAHEFGICLGLGREYENGGDSFLSFSGVETYDWPPNLATKISADMLESGTQPPNNVEYNVERFKWRKFSKKSRYNGAAAGAISRVTHPNSSQSKSQFIKARNKLSKNISILSHPNPSQVNEIDYLSGKNRRLQMDEPNLIEGGGGWRENVFRPSADCIMRSFHAKAQLPANINLKKIGFCRVCRLHLERVFFGCMAHRVGFSRAGSGSHFLQASYPSSAAEKLVKLVEKKKFFGQAPGTVDCSTMTLWRVEALFKEYWKWVPSFNRSLVKKELPAGQEDQEETRQFRIPIGFDFSEKQKMAFMALWQIHRKRLQYWCKGKTVPSNVSIKTPKEPPLQDVPLLRKFAGASAVGALTYAGFTSIRNRYRRKVDDEGKSYLLYENLSDEELAALPPGSILQIWKDEATYIKFVEKFVTDSDEVLPAANVGHSVVYMGVANNPSGAEIDFYVADQHKIKASLKKDSLLKKFTFYIAAQWFDLDGNFAKPLPPATGSFATVPLPLRPANDFASYIELIKEVEQTVPANYSSRDVLALFRQIYYGDHLFQLVIPCGKRFDGAQGNEPTPESLLGASLLSAIKDSVIIEGVDVGHVYCGLDAMFCPAEVKDIDVLDIENILQLDIGDLTGFLEFFSQVPAAPRVSNVDFVTWIGDLGSQVAMRVLEEIYANPTTNWSELDRVDVFNHGRSKSPTVDLVGDIDPFVMKSHILGFSMGARHHPLDNLDVSLSEIFEQYYLRPSSAYNSTTRYSTFVEILSGQNASANFVLDEHLLEQTSNQVYEFACLFFYYELLKRVRRKGIDSVSKSELIHFNFFSEDSQNPLKIWSRSYTRLFFTWLERKSGL